MKKWNPIFVILVACCGTANGEPVPHVTPVPGIEYCDEACAKLQDLNCVEGNPVPTEDGGTMECFDFCCYQHNNGVYWNTECLMNITACSEVETVCNVPPP